LGAWANHIRGLSDDDEGLYVLAALDCDPNQPVRPGEEAERLTRRFLFDLRTRALMPDLTGSSMLWLASAAAKPTCRPTARVDR
jgi:hypothetical protein